jgi:hypothetical protein
MERLSLLNTGLSEKVRYLNDILPNHKEDWTKRFDLKWGTNPHYGKISRIPDKEGKTRTITILNY